MNILNDAFRIPQAGGENYNQNYAVLQDSILPEIPDDHAPVDPEETDLPAPTPVVVDQGREFERYNKLVNLRPRYIQVAGILYSV